MKFSSRHIPSVARTMRDEGAYLEYNQSHPKRCDFCHIEISASKIISDHAYFMIVTNAFPYATWEGGHVTEHIMLVPKRHVESTSEFSNDEQHEFMKLLSRFEKNGYSFYGRGLKSKYKSIAHQHTHLMKVDKTISYHFYSSWLRLNIFK